MRRFWVDGAQYVAGGWVKQEDMASSSSYYYTISLIYSPNREDK